MFYCLAGCRHHSRTKIEDYPGNHDYDVWECIDCRKRFNNIERESERVENWKWGFKEWDWLCWDYGESIEEE